MASPMADQSSGNADCDLTGENFVWVYVLSAWERFSVCLPKAESGLEGKLPIIL